MRYWKAWFVYNQWWRYSIQYNNVEVQSILNDNIYNEDLKVNWLTNTYFFYKPEELEFSNDEIRDYAVLFMTPEESILRLQTNTNLKEVEPWKFEISPEMVFWEEIIPAQYLIITWN